MNNTLSLTIRYNPEKGTITFGTSDLKIAEILKRAFFDKTLTPVILRGKEIPDYFLDKDGNFYSTKRPKLRKMLVSTYKSKTCPYPKIGLMINGKVKTLHPHRLVCETFHKKPTPDILTEEQWSSMREDIRTIVLEHIEHADRWQVNHIDHNVNNYHPSNLEWVTVSENQQKYQQHKKLN